MNMFAKSSASSVDDYISGVPEGRREIIEFLHDFIQKAGPQLKPHFAYNMLGYGSFKYLNYKKQVQDWPTVALANQKNYISVYVCAMDHDQYLAEQYKDKLGKVNVGRSCIRFKKLEDINLEALKEVIQKAQSNPGVVGGTIIK